MLKLFKDCLTGPDGVSYDAARILWVGGIVVFLCFTGHEVYRKDVFDMNSFATAYGALLLAGAGGVKIKESTEPKV